MVSIAFCVAVVVVEQNVALCAAVARVEARPRVMEGIVDAVLRRAPMNVAGVVLEDAVLAPLHREA